MSMTFELAAVQAILAFIGFIIFALVGNIPAAPFALALFFTSMTLANESVS